MLVVALDTGKNSMQVFRCYVVASPFPEGIRETHRCRIDRGRVRFENDGLSV